MMMTQNNRRLFDFCATHSKIFVFVHKTFVKYLFWTQKIRKVFNFGPTYSKSIQIQIKTFAKYLISPQKIRRILIYNKNHSILVCIVFVHRTFESICSWSITFEKCWIFMENIRKTSCLYPKQLKSICSWPETFEKYRISKQNISNI